MPALRLLCGSATFFACLLCGCASTGFLKLGKADYPKATRENPVVQLMALWQPSSGVGNEMRSCRGFAGQIMFITANSPTPAEVEGEVTVWLFDDQGTPEEQAKPIHKFIFPAEIWKQYGKNGPLGMTYTIFVPYTRKGSHEARCTLLVGFAQKEGATIQSEMVNVELTGTKNKTKAISDSPVDDEAGNMSTTLKPVAKLDGDEAVASRRKSQKQATIQQIAASAYAAAEAEQNRGSRKLSPEDEKRIIREAMARQSARDAVDGDSDDVEYVPRAKSPKRHNPLNDESAAESGDDADYAEGPPVSLKRDAVRRRNPLKEASEENEPRERRRSDVSKPQRRNPLERDSDVVKPRKNPLERDDSIDAASIAKPRREVLTISLSGVN